MCEGGTFAGSPFASNQGSGSRLFKSPRSRILLHSKKAVSKPSSPQGRGCVKGEPLRGPPSRQIRAAALAFESPRSPHPPPPQKRRPEGVFFVVEEDGFEPSKSVTTDLQSAPFGRSGTPPYSVMSCGGGAGGRIRTPDLLITNQLLYRLSYTSVSAATILLYHSPGAKSSPKIQFFAAKQSGSRPTGQGAAVYSPSGRSQLSMCSSR